ncbi:quinoprotein dehydrogenase-associated putative ABC transporter substrate-binding protein [Noviherbaspirillum sp. Root189]|uniref:quinoprotein dehydrogenase-associated putative ABC transporter substrate-binding protein n=1 Tax=Noviherbaspirillum sp. Root189 TaxID=1736487 RepID=UPI0009EB307D|nr:quinoprotein dehydrogenase-associated putative ABC transporter substrate-binding protein [Noviherbaspirillum sp. Root189]
MTHLKQNHSNRLPRVRVLRAGVVFAAVAIAAGVSAPMASADDKDKVLRVCQDPNNLPFSNRDLMGFENKIAQLLGQELGWTVEYTWYPQRMGFVRNTLRAKIPDSNKYKCDLIVGVPKEFELGATTRPYYRSTYEMAYVKGKGFDSIKTPADLLALDPERRKALRLGVFIGSPATDWLLQNGMIDQIVSYQSQTGDENQYPGQIIEKDLAQGKIDFAFAWGPIVAYYAKNSTSAPIVAIPFKPQPDIKFDFSIAMAVRHGDKAFKEKIDQLIEKNQEKINVILSNYGVPMVDEHGDLLVSTLRR